MLILIIPLLLSGLLWLICLGIFVPEVRLGMILSYLWPCFYWGLVVLFRHNRKICRVWNIITGVLWLVGVGVATYIFCGEGGGVVVPGATTGLGPVFYGFGAISYLATLSALYSVFIIRPQIKDLPVKDLPEKRKKLKKCVVVLGYVLILLGLVLIM